MVENARESSTSGTNRRQFIRTAGATVGAAMAYVAPRTAVLGQQSTGANERIGVGFIGTGGRCQQHINIVNGFKKEGLAEPVAVCDVYRPRLEAAAKKCPRPSQFPPLVGPTSRR